MKSILQGLDLGGGLPLLGWKGVVGGCGAISDFSGESGSRKGSLFMGKDTQHVLDEGADLAGLAFWLFVDML